MKWFERIRTELENISVGHILLTWHVSDKVSKLQ